MRDALPWIYLLNSVVLIIHEIDSAYWKEWKLFKIPGGITSFLILHFPILILILWGQAQIFALSEAGLVISLLVALSGIIAYSIHRYFILKGHGEFKTTISQVILWTTLILSISQLCITLQIMLV